MLSTYWKAKSDGYELVDGSAYSSSSSLQCSPTLDEHRDLIPLFSQRPKKKEQSSSSSLTLSPSLGSSILCLLRRNRRKVSLILFAIVAFSILETILGIILAPPAYVVLEPNNYLQTLQNTVRDRLSLQSTDARQAILTNLQGLDSSSSDALLPLSGGVIPPPLSLVPNKLFSSDKHAPPTDWAPMWKDKGFEPHFYDDEEANEWVERVWKNTDVVRAWRTMPRSILRADMLRYLLLLIEGGTWSDMDTVPIMHLANWTTDTVPFHYNHISRLHRNSSPAASIRRYKDSKVNTTGTYLPPPINAIISLECVPTWYSLRGALELLRMKPLNRHRNLQFVQWTIHIGPHHPILVDVLRRILETMNLYEAYKVEAERESQRHGWGWEESSAGPTDSSLASSVAPLRHNNEDIAAPWESIDQQWMYTNGHWRLGWHPTSVEEWTGPGVWTDAVVSYIYATTGVRPEQLAKIKKPTQVGDLLILPEDGFNPPKGSLKKPYSITRVVHLFRGSWKQSKHKNINSP